jgi:peroxiredoxin
MRPIAALIVFRRVAALLATALLIAAAPALALPEKGDDLPALTLTAPDRAEDSVYLGVEQEKSFSLLQADFQVLLVEIVGVYCPFCHQQAPLFNALRKRLQRSGLDDKVKMVALASGATEQEIEFLREHSGYAFPVLRDEDYSVHKQLGEPKTPFTMIVDREGTVLETHMGILYDMDALFNRLRGMVE